jgi:O-antigen/teichoic acid export membrane protein
MIGKAYRRVAASRVGRGTAAGIYAQFIQLAIQIITVPVLTGHWGVAGYGAWVLLFTVPQMMAMSDLGLTVAGANAMTAAAAKGDLPHASRIYASLRWASLAMALTFALSAALVLVVLRPQIIAFAQPFTHGHAQRTVLVMLAYTVFSMQNAVTIAGYRAADAFATSQTVYDTGLLLETLAALATAALGYGLEGVALMYLGSRLVLSGAMAINLRRLAPWLRLAGWRCDPTELRRLWRPALAAFLLPAAQGITLQGSVACIGAFAGPAAVPAFSTIRTISRTALQFTYRFNFASMPRYTALHATHDEAGKTQLVLGNLLVAAVLLLPAFPVLLLIGPSVVSVWTAGAVHVAPSLLALMLLVMVLNGAWVPMSNLICAINEHHRFTLHYLAVSALSIGAGALLLPRWGAQGMAMALVAQEAVMALIVWRIALRMGMITPALLREASVGLAGRVRAMLARVGARG